MTSFFSRYTVAACAALALLGACKKSSDPSPAPGPGPFTLEFENVAGDVPLELGAKNYTSPAGVTFNVAALGYYVSNIRLKRSDGSMYAVPGAFFMHLGDVDAQAADIDSVLGGSYVGATFTVGLDSATAFAPDSAHDSYRPYYLAGTYGGTAFVLSTTNRRGQAQANLPTVTISFPTAAEVQPGRHPEAHALHDVDKVFGSGALPATDAAVANNIANSFVVAHVHND